jgi:hypothetical protein
MTIIEWALLLVCVIIAALCILLQERTSSRSSSDFADGVIADLKSGLDHRRCHGCNINVWQEPWMRPSCPRCGRGMEKMDKES